MRRLPPTRRDDEERHRPLQLIALRPRCALTQTFRNEKAVVCHMSVQWLEVWATRGDADNPQLDAFEVEDPTYLDLADFVSSVDRRNSVWCWKEVPCDTEGCVALVEPSVVQANCELNSRSVPVLCLVDHLKADS